VSSKHSSQIASRETGIYMGGKSDEHEEKANVPISERSESNSNATVERFEHPEKQKS
jgi:hypothetical protein